MDSSLLTLFIASAIVLSIEMVLIFLADEAISESGIVSVTINSSSLELLIFFKASPERTAWVA